MADTVVTLIAGRERAPAELFAELTRAGLAPSWLTEARLAEILRASPGILARVAEDPALVGSDPARAIAHLVPGVELRPAARGIELRAEPDPQRITAHLRAVLEWARGSLGNAERLTTDPAAALDEAVPALPDRDREPVLEALRAWSRAPSRRP